MGLQDDFISNMKKLRKERNLTQEKLAELCSTDTAYIGQIETKRRFPSISLIEKIAKALDCEPYVLFKSQNINFEKTTVSKEDLKEKLLKEFENSLNKIFS